MPKLKTRRIGDQMRNIAYAVRSMPGQTPYCYAKDYRTANGHASVRYGSRVVDRALVAGLIRSEPNPARKGSTILFPVVD